MRRLSVVHIISALPFGGVEQNLLRVLPLLNSDRFDVSVVCTRELGDMAPMIEKTGVPVELCYLKSRYNPQSLWALSKVLKRKKADVIHCHMRRANTSGRIAAMLAGVPVRIVTEHDMCLGKNQKHYIVDRMLAPATDVIIGVTKAVVELNRERTGIAAEKFRAMYLGLDLEVLANRPSRDEARKALGLSDEAKVIGHIGRMHGIKNIDAIIRAMKEPQLGGAILLLIGDGPERGKLEELTRQLGLEERVVFAGWQTDLPLMYAAMDAQVMASSSEGIATVQMESMATEVPLVSTPVGFAREILTAGREYVEVAAPEPKLLAVGMAEVLDPETGKRLAAAGLDSIREFSIEKQAESWAELYLELAAKHAIQ